MKNILIILGCLFWSLKINQDEFDLLQMKFKKIRVLNFVFTIILLFGTFCVEAAGPQELRYLRAVFTLCHLALTDLGADQDERSPVDDFLKEFLIPHLADGSVGASAEPPSVNYLPKVSHRTVFNLTRPTIWRMSKTFTTSEWGEFKNQLTSDGDRWRAMVNNKNQRRRARGIAMLGGWIYVLSSTLFPLFSNEVSSLDGNARGKIAVLGLGVPIDYILVERLYRKIGIIEAPVPSVSQMLGSDLDIILRVPINQKQLRAIIQITKGGGLHEDEKLLNKEVERGSFMTLANTPFGFWKKRPYELQIIHFWYAGKYVLEMRIVKR